MGKKHKKKKNTVDLYKELYSEMDGTFAFIAGHTSGGAPYGLTSVNEEDELPFD